LFSAPAVSYRARLGADDPAMGVAVQLMVDAEVSGVMFTCSPVSGDPSMVAINASWGLGLAVVGGEVTPDDYLVSKVTGEIVREQVSDKAVEYVPRPDGRGTLRREVPEGRRRARCLDEDQLRALVGVARTVQRHFGAHQDVEWAIDRSGDLFVVQSRPVTTLREREAKPAPASAISMVMKTFGVPGQGG
jgi:pyruvate,water dikinase